MPRFFSSGWITAVSVAAALFAGGQTAHALPLTTLTFGAFAGCTPGPDCLSDVNAATTPLGATFDVSPGGQARDDGMVGLFQIVDGSTVRSGGWPGEADVVVVFSEAVNFVSVRFTTNPDDDSTVRHITVYDVPITPTGMLPAPIATSGNVDSAGTLSLSVAGIRSLQLEEGTCCVFFDQVTYETRIPEPGTFAILAVGLAGLGMTRRKRAA